MRRSEIDLPHPPRSRALIDPALGLAPYTGTLFAPTMRFVGDEPPYAPAVAIVGTRRADPEAERFAFGLARDLAARGVVIVSGGALGIDAAAHEGALAAGRTVAVLATGLSRAYPPQHAGLFSRIARQGALVSPYEDDATAAAFRLLERNALIAAMVSAVVVVQAPVRSGALATAAAARSFGRTVFAAPSAPWDERGRGSLALLEAGAGLCVDAAQVAASVGVGISDERASPVASLPDDLDPDARRVLRELSSRPRHVDELDAAGKLGTARVQRALMTLLLAGLVEERAGGRYVRSAPL